MGQSLEKAVTKAATDTGLLGIESAEINLDSDINLNLDSSAIGIVVTVVIVLVIVIIVIIALCSKYCCNCCDNLCFQGKGQNLHKKQQLGQSVVIRDGQFGTEYNSNLNPAMSILPPDYENATQAGCPSCGSQMGYNNGSQFGCPTGLKRSPSLAASFFPKEEPKTKVDGYILPVSAASDYQTMSHLEKSQMIRTNPTVQYCTMSNGELGMYIPKANLLDVLEHSHSKIGTLKSSKSMKYYQSDRERCSTMKPRLEYYTTETEVEGKRERKSGDERKRRRRKSRHSRSHRSSGYKSDSSHSRPKSNRTITLSSLSDNEAESAPTYHRRQMTIIEETGKSRRKRNSKLSNVEEQLFTAHAFPSPQKQTYT